MIHDGVSAVAVASQFAKRNPAYELRAEEIVKELTGKLVSASHQLPAKLNGPKRALTALLGARLIGMIDRLIHRKNCTSAKYWASGSSDGGAWRWGTYFTRPSARKPNLNDIKRSCSFNCRASWLTGA